MKLKVISDGTPHGSKLVNAETGELIENVLFIDIKIDARNGVTGTVRFEMLQVDLAFSTAPAG